MQQRYIRGNINSYNNMCGRGHQSPLGEEGLAEEDDAVRLQIKRVHSLLVLQLTVVEDEFLIGGRQILDILEALLDLSDRR